MSKSRLTVFSFVRRFLLRLMVVLAVFWGGGIALFSVAPVPFSAVMVERQVSAWLHGNFRYVAHSDWVSMDQISPWMGLAVIAAEDQKFPEHWGFDVQMADLYRFMRKILEKYNWDVRLGMKMLSAYHKEKSISEDEWQNIHIRFLYPEKYWKLANYYYSHKKVWISEKNVEKLQNLIRQREIWENFAEECFRDYPRYCSLRSQ